MTAQKTTYTALPSATPTPGRTKPQRRSRAPLNVTGANPSKTWGKREIPMKVYYLAGVKTRPLEPIAL
jgi:hypothetical protein